MTSQVVTASLVAAALYGFKLVNEGYFASREEKERLARETTKKKGGKGNVDSVFFKRILHLLKTVLPDAKCREAQYIYLLGILLVVRTILSIWLADVQGSIVKTIVGRDFNMFLKRVSLRFYLLDSCSVPFCSSFILYQFCNRLLRKKTVSWIQTKVGNLL